MLEQLAGLARQRHREVLGVVKLLPVALGREFRDPHAQGFQAVGGFRHGLHQKGRDSLALFDRDPIMLQVSSNTLND